MSRFTQTLDSIELILESMTRRYKIIRELYEANMYEACQAQLLRLEENSERLTLLTRALPCYTGARSAPEDVSQIIRDVIPVKIGFTEEGWFCLHIPLLLPKKQSGSVNYLRGFLLPAMRDFFLDKPLARYPKCVLIYRHVYARDCPERQYRDHDNIEINQVSDIVALYTMPDDAPMVCRHFYCSAAGNSERTEVYVVPQQDFAQWLKKEESLPDEGTILFENLPFLVEKDAQNGLQNEPAKSASPNRPKFPESRRFSEESPAAFRRREQSPRRSSSNRR